MKQYFLKFSGAALLLALTATSVSAQQGDGEIKKVQKDDMIIVRPKVSTDVKVTIEVKDGEVKVNGKPLSEFKDDDVTVSRRKSLDEVVVRGMPGNSRFRGTYNYNFNDNGNWFGEDKAFLGVTSDKVSDGAKITEISKGSAAEKAGLKEGDIITGVNDTKISSPEDLSKAIGKCKPEEKVTVSYKRDGASKKESIALGKRKSMAITYSPGAFNMDQLREMQGLNGYIVNGRPRLGIKAQETEEGKGLKVLGVDEESAADKSGIKEGDVITEFDGVEVNSVEKLRETAAKSVTKPSFKVKLLRDGKSQEVQVKIPKNLKTTNL